MNVGASCVSRNTLFRRLLTASIVVASLWPTPSLWAEDTADERQSRYLEQKEKLLLLAMDVAERACLSNTSSTEAASLRLTLHNLRNQISSAAGIEKKIEAMRGAAQSLPASAQLIENDKIRNCINQKIQPFFEPLIQSYTASAERGRWPDPIDFRFNFTRGPSKNQRLYSPFLRTELLIRGQPVSRRLVVQDPQGGSYFDQDIPYPGVDEDISGTIVAERNPISTLTSSPPAITDICIQRVSSLPPLSKGPYDLFDCIEGHACQPSTRAAGWLHACRARNAPPTAFAGFKFFAEAHAEVTQVATKADESRFWSVPSLASLTQSNSEGVGYTVFAIKTDAFRHGPVTAVEVKIQVNGVPVREDGLPSRLRPIANDPRSSFSHNFALQTLDFEGAEGGCDRIKLELQPLARDGEQNTAHAFSLTYVALRDVAPRTQTAGDSTLAWSAAYITPLREWRHLAEVNSYIYSTGDSASQQRAVGMARSSKKWLDQQQLSYLGSRVVGIIRPPRTVQPNGTAAYGLAAGLLQESGQVRFTFSEGDARKLASFIISYRGHGAEAARSISPKPYIFQAVGGSHSAPGICQD
jgi:hypothetical protein